MNETVDNRGLLRGNLILQHVSGDRTVSVCHSRYWREFTTHLSRSV